MAAADAGANGAGANAAAHARAFDVRMVGDVTRLMTTSGYPQSPPLLICGPARSHGRRRSHPPRPAQSRPITTQAPAATLVPPSKTPALYDHERFRGHMCPGSFVIMD